MCEPLFIYGAAYPDVVKLVAAINAVKPTWEIQGFIDDTPEKQEQSFVGFPIVGGAECLETLDISNTWFFCNVFASTADRRHVVEKLSAAGCRFATLVHPSVDVALTEIGKDTMISEGVVLSANVKIGDHCAVRGTSIVNHHNVIEDFVFVGPGVTLSGYVTIRSGAFIGSGVTIKDRLEVGPDSILGAGCVAIQDVPAGECVVGVPAVRISHDRASSATELQHENATR